MTPSSSHQRIELLLKKNICMIFSLFRLTQRGIDGEQLQLADSSNILSNDERRLFWLQWANNKIEFGKGSRIGQDHIIE